MTAGLVTLDVPCPCGAVHHLTCTYLGDPESGDIRPLEWDTDCPSREANL